MNRFPDQFADSTRGDPSPVPAALADELARLEPASASPHLRDRIALALSAEATTHPVGRSSHGRYCRVRWLGERLAWAGAGCLVASLLMAGPDARQIDAETSATSARAVDPAGRAEMPSISLADEGIQYLAAERPARIYRPHVLERRTGADGDALVLVPQKELYVVPVMLR